MERSILKAACWKDKRLLEEVASGEILSGCKQEKKYKKKVYIVD